MQHAGHHAANEVEPVGFHGKLFEAAAFEFPLPSQHGRLDLVKHDAVVERLFHVREGAELDGPHGRLELAVTGQNDDLDVGIEFFDLAQEVHAGLAGHANVGDHEIDGLLAKEVERRGHVLGHVDLVLLLQKHTQGLAGPVFVVHNENTRKFALFHLADGGPPGESMLRTQGRQFRTHSSSSVCGAPLFPSVRIAIAAQSQADILLSTRPPAASPSIP